MKVILKKIKSLTCLYSFQDLSQYSQESVPDKNSEESVESEDKEEEVLKSPAKMKP